MKSLIIYNLFPKLCGYMSNWKKHIDRACEMNFNCIYINPVQYSGFSGSLYSIKDYYKINDMFIDPKNGTGEEQLKDIINYIHSKKMKIITDLVINHTAIDSELTKTHSNWYKKNEDGSIYNPRVIEGDPKTGKVVIWGDLADIDNENSPDKDNLWNYWNDLVEYFIRLGFDGFRCDAAYMVPDKLWKFIIENAKKKNKNILFLAETLGCEIEDIIKLADCGFSYTFNSSKYWDFKEDWCMKQYWENSQISSSVSFAESHDTERLFKEHNGNIESVKLRYIFSVIFSSAVMMPIGFEFGVMKKIDVVKTNPMDWEETNIDITKDIKKANKLKSYSVFCEDNPTIIVKNDEEQIVSLFKTSLNGKQRALVIINTDGYSWHKASFENLYNIFGNCSKIKDISLKNPMEIVPKNFEYNMKPSEIRILIQDLL